MPRILKRILAGLLSLGEIAQVYSSFDTVGDIAIIKVPPPLAIKKKVIAQAILDNIKSIKTVLCQASPISGDYRIRGLEYVAGENKTTTIYREHGVTYEVDLAKVYFSPRLSAERLRIANQVRPCEIVVNLFAGIGAISILIAKRQPTAKVYSIDINPDAYALACKNVQINKVSGRVTPILGDAKDVVERLLTHVADRVVMPLPEKAHEYLTTAIQSLRCEGVLHYYTHVHASKGESPLEKAKKELSDSLIYYPYDILYSGIVREVGPRWSQVVIDVKIYKR